MGQKEKKEKSKKRKDAGKSGKLPDAFARFADKAFNETTELSEVEHTLEQLNRHRLLDRECSQSFRAAIAEVAKTIVFKTRLRNMADEDSEDEEESTVTRVASPEKAQTQPA